VPDEMFFGPDGVSLRRGQRRDKRIASCRPCLVWPDDAPEMQCEGVIMDMNRHGLLVRMLDPFPEQSELYVQMMRDESFEHALAKPLRGVVVRCREASSGFVDHGIQFVREAIVRAQNPRPVRIEELRQRPSRPARMHSIDVTIGDRGPRGRYR